MFRSPPDGKLSVVFADYNQQDATFHSIFISVRRCTCFRRDFLPSSGAQNCIYSVRYELDKCLTLYVQFWAPDDGRKTRLKHVERLREINKLRKVASCWLKSANILAMHGPMNVKLISFIESQAISNDLKIIWLINHLTLNDPNRGRNASLTSKRYILYFYSTNIGTEYFKHGIYSPLFSLQNAICFIILTYLVPVLITFYIQGVLKLKK